MRNKRPSRQKQGGSPVASPAKPPKDLVLVHGKDAKTDGLKVIRLKEDRVEAAVLQPLAEGKPIEGEVVRLTPRKESPILFDAETQVRVGTRRSAHTGQGAETGQGADTRSLRVSGAAVHDIKKPAKVSSYAYRSGWDSIWGNKPRRTAFSKTRAKDLN